MRDNEDTYRYNETEKNKESSPESPMDKKIESEIPEVTKSFSPYNRDSSAIVVK